MQAPRAPLSPTAMKQQQQHNGRLLLVSDYDDTLFGSRADPRHTNASAAFASAFAELRRRRQGPPLPEPGSPPVRLAINTGRTLPLFADHPDAELRMAALGLRPDVLIAGVGTRVYWRRRRRRHDGEGEGEGGGVDSDAAGAAADADDDEAFSWVEDAAWTEAVGSGWVPELARAAVEGALAALPAPLRGDARLQRDEELHAHKLTVSFRGEKPDAETLCAEIARRFAELGAAREPPRLVTGPCGDNSSSAGRRYVDVLPASSGKGNAMLFVANALGYGANEVVSAGDSHNDLCMLRHPHQRRAIVVGNAHPELRAALSGVRHAWLAPEDCVGAAAVLRGMFF